MRKQEKKAEQVPLRGRIAEASGLPKDVVMGMPILTMIGNSEVYIENYRGIQEYTDLLIHIQTKIGQMRLYGSNLKIEYYTNDEMKVTGKIKSIEYQ